MKKVRTFGVAAVIAAAAAVPLVGGSFAGAQDAGDCGAGGTAAAATSTNVGGLIGALAPVQIQTVAPINAPILSPSSQSCTENINKVSVGGGGGHSGGGHSGGGHSGGGHSGGGGGGVAPAHVGGAAPAVAIGGAPTFAG
jgi:uncharacterized membrane protein YgcG